MADDYRDEIIRTREQANAYGRSLANLRGESVLIFAVPSGTRAYEWGYRFGVCFASERSEYVADGAEFVGAVEPTSEKS